MRNKTIIGLILLFVFILSISINAQDKKEKAEQKIKLPRRYMEQNWERTVRNLTANIMAAITYAKSNGKTARDYGRFVGELYADTWKKGRGPAYFAMGIYRSVSQFPNSQTEILSESESNVTMRVKRTWEDFIGTGSGMKVEDFNEWVEGLWGTIADHIGLKYEQKIDGDWLVIKLDKKNVKDN